MLICMRTSKWWFAEKLFMCIKFYYFSSTIHKRIYYYAFHKVSTSSELSDNNMNAKELQKGWHNYIYIYICQQCVDVWIFCISSYMLHNASYTHTLTKKEPSIYEGSCFMYILMHVSQFL